MKTRTLLLTIILMLALALAGCNRSASTAPTATPAAAPAAKEAPAVTTAAEGTASAAETTAPVEPAPAAEGASSEPAAEPAAAAEGAAETATEPAGGEPTPELIAETPAVTHVVQPGENLFRIGLKYDLAWSTIAAANNLANPHQIYAGQVLTIPPAPEGELGPLTHTVRPGENLFRIGLLYNVSWVNLAWANYLPDPYRIYPGQVLVIPTPAAEPESALPPAGGPAAAAAPLNYTVRPGENLFRIGLAHNLPWTAIASANGVMDPRTLRAGQTLVIPPAGEGEQPLYSLTHIIRPGETLYRISQAYAVPATSIMAANEISDPNLIKAWDALTIPPK